MSPASATALQWDDEPTGVPEAPALHRLHGDSQAVAPAITLDPDQQPTSTRESEASPRSSRGTLLAMSRKTVAQQATARPLAEWQGYVTKIEGDHLYATMEGVFGAGVEGKRHDAVIPLSEVAPDDQRLVRDGAYFRLSVAYATSQAIGGTFIRSSTLVFRRLPAYHAADLERARDIARELLAGIRLE